MLRDGGEDLCTYQIIFDATKSTSQICQLVKDNCGDIPQSFDLFQLRFCQLPHPIIFYILITVIVICSFYLLGSVADTYLTPVLTKLSEALKLSETVAGVTLLAFANGAPDIIASITAAIASSGGKPDPTGMYIGAGALFGACAFGSTIVVATCTLRSSVEIKV